MAKPFYQSPIHNVLFKEEQGFTQWYIWLLLFVILLIPGYGIIQQMILEVPFGDNPMSNLGLIVFLIGMLLLCLFFWKLKMRTIITRDHLYIKFKPLANKRIRWKDVASAEIVKYSPMIGYGMRFSPLYGTVYNVKGRKGLALKLKNGKKLMIGTQRYREIEDVALGVLRRM
ncbi:MAG: hypothetical protein HKO75_09675 [Flavobacteriaceae bacterium]|nr:hypothetical protein [Muriicola sp.]NNC62070.1 hypothetical protein [Eudoraea sp.]NNK21139.1 hypothetical protein [Flavobacteriaceae bacterium]MBT8289197.1 hypothetical protein [Muriicola sp.]NNK34390.1 hypothetical protein [Eudoraea sp.]